MGTLGFIKWAILEENVSWLKIVLVLIAEVIIATQRNKFHPTQKNHGGCHDNHHDIALCKVIYFINKFQIIAEPAR